MYTLFGDSKYCSFLSITLSHMFTPVIDLSYPLRGRQQMTECEAAHLNRVYPPFPTTVHDSLEI